MRLGALWRVHGGGRVRIINKALSGIANPIKFTPFALFFVLIRLPQKRRQNGRHMAPAMYA